MPRVEREDRGMKQTMEWVFVFQVTVTEETREAPWLVEEEYLEGKPVEWMKQLEVSYDQ